MSTSELTKLGDEESSCKGYCDWDKLWASLEKVAQCPVCLELLRPPVTLCLNGHGTCTTCRNSSAITKCPLCQKPFSDIQPKVLDDILSKIPKTCKYNPQGCKLPSLNDHEIYCKFRPMKCIFIHEGNCSYCTWEGVADEWLEHIYDEHDMGMCWIDAYSKEKIYIPLEFKEPPCARAIYGYDEDSKYFVFYYKKFQGNFYLHIKHFPLEKPTEKYYFTISFKDCSGEEVYKYKIKVTTMITHEPDVKVEENVFSMRVPIEELEKLDKKDGKLVVTFKRTTEPL